MSTEFITEPKFAYPGVYSIWVTGKVRNEILDYFHGIISEEISLGQTGLVETSLIVQVRDQAELLGLVNLLYDWQHVLLSVRLQELSISNSQ